MSARVSLVVVVLSLGFAPAPFPKTERQEHADMTGVWRSGNSEETQITATRMTLSYKTERPWPYELTVNTKVRPATFELRGVPGSPTANSHWKGIYRVRGGVLTFSYNRGDGPMPTAFEGLGSGQYTNVYARERR